MCGMLPPFDDRGLLPAGIHPAGWSEFRERFAWNAIRAAQFGGLRRAATILARFGCGKLYLDGSYVTEKELPGDYDAIWDAGGVDLEGLQAVEPFFLLNFPTDHEVLKIKFGGEFFPVQMTEGRSGRPFLDFFQIDKETGGPKGIVSLQTEPTDND